jgi:hypothetical protein
MSNHQFTTLVFYNLFPSLAVLCISSKYSADRPSTTAPAAAGVQRRSQKLVVKSMHWKSGAPLPMPLPVVDWRQFLHAGWHPPGDMSRHEQIGGIDLVHSPQVSQHGHARAPASPPGAAAAAPPPPSSPPLTSGRAARTATTDSATSSTWGLMLVSPRKNRQQWRLDL